MKGLLNRYTGIFILLLSQGFCFGQADTLPYRDLKSKIIWFSDLGYASAPFSIFHSFNEDIERLKYRNNIRTVFGFGGSYKWFSLRIAFSLPGNLRPVSRYGNTDQLNFGTEFSIRKVFFDLDLRRYKGYSVQNAFYFDPELNGLNPNDIRSDVVASSFSVNAWYFRNGDFKIQALKGRTAYFKEEVKTWYLKSTMNIFGVFSDSYPIIPELLVQDNHKTSSDFYSAFDMGVIPGYAYVNRFGNWQLGGLAGLGGVLQFNFHEINGILQDQLWLAPRYDIRFIGGYNIDRYFLMLLTDFDNKSIRMKDLRYRQAYYSIRVAAGIRLDKKGKTNKRKK